MRETYSILVDLEGDKWILIGNRNVYIATHRKISNCDRGMLPKRSIAIGFLEDREGDGGHSRSRHRGNQADER